MRPLRRWTSLGLIGLFAAAALTGLAATSARAVTPPADQYAQGYVGLCNKAGQNITSGSVYNKPFVWRAVGSQAAPAPFNSSSRRATLYAFQPRPDVDASQWTGTPMTAASHYTNAAVPMSEATHRDFALSDYLNDYPPEVNGIVELRMLYSSSDTGYSTGYAASFIQIHGTTWTLIKGGRVNCNAGTARSSEAGLLKYDRAGKQPPQLLSVVAAKAVGAPTSRAANLAARDAALHGTSPSPSGAANPSGGSSQSGGSSAGGGSDGGTSAAADSGSSSSGGPSPGLIAGIVIAVILAAGAGIWWQQARRSAGQR